MSIATVLFTAEGLDTFPEDLVKANSTSSSTAGQKISSYLKSNSAQDAILRDIGELSDIVTSIENDFSVIGFSMSKLDERNIAPVKFSPKWKAHHDNYTALMRSSQRTANDISNKIDEFVGVQIPILQDQKVDMVVKKEILSDYIKEIEHFIPEAERTSTRFLRLVQAVQSFRKDLIPTVQTEESKVENKFLEIEAKIMELESSLRSFSSRFTWKALMSFLKPWETEEDDEIAAITSLTDIAPSVGRDIADIVLNYLNSELAGDLQKRQKKMKTEEKKMLLSKLKFMDEQRDLISSEFQDVFRDLCKLEPVFDKMIDKISAIQGIWLMLLKDSQALLDRLSRMRDAKHYIVFRTMLTQLEATYVALQFALNQYSLVVAKPN